MASSIPRKKRATFDSLNTSPTPVIKSISENPAIGPIAIFTSLPKVSFNVTRTTLAADVHNVISPSAASSSSVPQTTPQAQTVVTADVITLETVGGNLNTATPQTPSPILAIRSSPIVASGATTTLPIPNTVTTATRGATTTFPITNPAATAANYFSSGVVNRVALGGKVALADVLLSPNPLNAGIESGPLPNAVSMNIGLLLCLFVSFYI